MRFAILPPCILYCLFATFAEVSLLCAQSQDSTSAKTSPPRAAGPERYSEKEKLRKAYVERAQKRIDSLRKKIYLEYQNSLNEKQSGIYLENLPMNYPKGYIPSEEDTVISTVYQTNWVEKMYDAVVDFMPEFGSSKFLKSKRIIRQNHRASFGLLMRGGMLSYDLISYAPNLEVSTGIRGSYKYRTSNYLIVAKMNFGFGKLYPWIPEGDEVLDLYDLYTRELSIHVKGYFLTYINYYTRTEYLIGVGWKQRSFTYQKRTRGQNHFAFKGVSAPTFSFVFQKFFRGIWTFKWELEVTPGNFSHDKRYTLTQPYEGESPLLQPPQNPLWYALKNSFFLSERTPWIPPTQFQNVVSSVSTSVLLNRNTKISIGYTFDFRKEKGVRTLIQTQNDLTVSWILLW